MSRAENGHAMFSYQGQEACASKKNKDERNKCFDGYFSGVKRKPEAKNCAKPALGGKLWGSHMLGSAAQQLRPALIEYLALRKVVVVLLFRANALDHVLSNAMIAATDGGNDRMHCRVNSKFFEQSQTGAAAVKNNPCVDTTKVVIDPKRVVDKATEKRALFEAQRNVWGIDTTDQFAGGVSHTRGFPVLYLPYETLKSNGTHLWRQAAELLTGDAPAGAADGDALFGPDATVKRIRRPKRDVISNYAALEAVLRKNDLGALLDDH